MENKSDGKLIVVWLLVLNRPFYHYIVKCFEIECFEINIIFSFVLKKKKTPFRTMIQRNDRKRRKKGPSVFYC